jgi:hypothetical protein
MTHYAQLQINKLFLIFFFSYETIQLAVGRARIFDIIMAISLALCLPANLKSMQPYLDMATDYESKDPCISYWCN